MKTVMFYWIGWLFLSAPLAALADGDVLARLGALPGVTATETTLPIDEGQGLRRFVIQIEQPVDHFDPESGTFRQKLVLFHRGFEEPMVLQTSGYSIFAERLSLPARLFATNQLQVEHRYFEGSSPGLKDWSKLTVRQSAEDFHRIVVVFKSLYGARWINTGGSKGGMTSVYHRRFHPNDLDGTLADVAPLSFSTEDARYISFIEGVGGEKYAMCRERLEGFQATLLSRRDEILPEIDGEHTHLGGKKTSFEHAVLELPFAFWQYGNPDDWVLGCRAIPSKSDPVRKLMDFLVGVNDPSSYGDSFVARFGPYFFQAAAELGAPGTKSSHLGGLITQPYTLDQYLPKGAVTTYEGATMRDIETWVAQEARGILFVYGEYDPWTAGEFKDLNPGSDNHRYLVAGGNHGAEIDDLAEPQRNEAIATLARWLDKAPASGALRHRNGVKAKSLRDLEVEAMRKLGLR